jgi:SAM-dependent methyltransferase
VPYDRELDHTFAGIALGRNWLVGDRASSERLLAAVQELVEQADNPWFDAPLRDASAGYGEWSQTYDDPGNWVVSVEDEVMRTLFAALPAGRALDAACGTGRHALTLEQLGHDVIGVDTNASMLARAREKSTTLELRTGDLAELPLDDASVDLAVCALALTHLSDLRLPVAELARVVRPGGRVLLTDVHPVCVFMGAQALYRTGVGEARAYVRNHVHWHGAYVAAANAADLRVAACHDLALSRTESDAIATGVSLPADLVADALVGFPAVVVWELEKP